MFNEQMINFQQELININIDTNLSNISKQKLLLLKKINPKKIIEIFICNIYLYKEQIINKDVDFIKNNININDSDNNYKIFKIIKDNWDNYSNNTKENIWLYMNVFISLCDKYLETKNNKNNNERLY
jgi:hypothetical protein